ncbi:SLC13 family permease [Puniceicoccaceae bacterium K14]|nr:SLC13 family permease [Puniceicoccaceae bacterium K14]
MKIDLKRCGFWLGFLVLGITLVMDSPVEGLSPMAWKTAGLGTMMALWWMTECLPLAVTAFMPLVIVPFVGLSPIKSLSSSYAHPLIFLFLGGFLLSIAMEKTGLHLRIARGVVNAIGSSPKRQVGGMMLVTAFLSMWMSNTATTIMMLPVAMSTIAAVSASSKGSISPSFAPTALLCIAYGASIGGMATLIGTPPNALLAAYLESSYGIEIGFGQWMLFGVPFSVILLILTWFLVASRGLGEVSNEAFKDSSVEPWKKLGAMSRSELLVAIVFGTTAICWMLRSYLNSSLGLSISDTGIAMTAATLLFMLPSSEKDGGRLMIWEDTKKVPWGVLILFGGGLALAGLMKSSGLTEFIGGLFEGLAGWDPIWVIAAVVLAVVFLTEITSNTATTAGLLPLMGPIAVSMGGEPVLLAIPAAVIASCAFMLPVATPPNAIVFASGELKISQMVRAGIRLNVLSAILLVIFARWLAPLVF